MTTIWRLAWREHQDAAPPLERREHRDTLAEAEALAEAVVRGGRVLGEVFVYELGEVA